MLLIYVVQTSSIDSSTSICWLDIINQILSNVQQAPGVWGSPSLLPRRPTGRWRVRRNQQQIFQVQMDLMDQSRGQYQARQRQLAVLERLQEENVSHLSKMRY